MTVAVNCGPFVLGRGTGLYKELQVLGDDGSPISLSGCTIYMDLRDEPTTTAAFMRLQSGQATTNGSNIAITDAANGRFSILITPDDAEDETIFAKPSRATKYQRLIPTTIIILDSEGADLLGEAIPFPILFDETMTRPGV